MDQFAGKGREPVGLTFRPAVINENVLALNVSELAHSLPEGFKKGRASGRGIGSEVAYPRYFLRLLRLGYDCNSKQYQYKQD
jgi:hypothetical protein